MKFMLLLCVNMSTTRVVKFPPENFQKFIPVFPEIYTANFPPVKTFELTVHLLTSSLSIAVTSPLVSSSALIVTLKICD